MFTVELYARIGRAVMVDGLSRREAAPMRCCNGGCDIAIAQGVRTKQSSLGWRTLGSLSIVSARSVWCGAAETVEARFRAKATNGGLPPPGLRLHRLLKEVVIPLTLQLGDWFLRRPQARLQKWCSLDPVEQNLQRTSHGVALVGLVMLAALNAPESAFTFVSAHAPAGISPGLLLPPLLLTDRTMY
jgi:hypothetical protein